MGAADPGAPAPAGGWITATPDPRAAPRRPAPAVPALPGGGRARTFPRLLDLEPRRRRERPPRPGHARRHECWRL